MVTIKQIAEYAGVTTTTVSNVIHGKTNKVSRETRDKVQAILDEMNYVPQMGLRVLSNKSSKIIGVVVCPHKHYEDTIFTDPFFGKVLGLLEHLLQERGYYMMVYSAESMNEVYTMAVAWNVDGIIGVSIEAEDYKNLKKLLSKPVAVIDLQYKEKPEFEVYNVGLEDRLAAKRMVEWLLERGRKNIIYLSNDGNGADYWRWKGCEDAVYQKNVGDIHGEWISVYRKERLEQYKKLEQYVGKDYVFFFSADYYAAEAQGYLMSRGVRVPEDCGIVGFDDNNYSQILYPQITTIHQDVEKKSKLAVDMMMCLLEGEAIPEKEILLDTEIVVRGSVK